MKVDVLALGMLTAIRRGFELIARHYGETFDLVSVPKEGPRSTRCCAGPIPWACSRSRAGRR